MELNATQKSAVEHDTGPLLIIAGAGTGKTRVITSRIVNLINEGKAAPSDILALTFTEKAANEMAERVDAELPLGYEEIFVKTFHAFSERVLRDFGLEMGIDPGYKILSGADSWFFFKKHLFEFELNYYRPLGNPNSFIYALLGHFGKLRDELISPERYINYSKKLSGEEGEKMLEVANAYKKYQDLLMQNNYLEFGDLSYYAIQLFEKRSSVLAQYQSKFKYILVDEFQDTNFAQYRLVHLLAKEHGNIVVVGDDDQSIYKWRGASLSNIINFQKDFPTFKSVVLADNYRSTQGILDTSYSLIQYNNPNRLEQKEGIMKKLTSHTRNNENIEINHFTNFVDEASFVATKIRELNSNGSKYGDCAILVRANHFATPYMDELRLLGIPYQVRDPRGLLALDEIKDLISVVKFLANPYNDIALLRILKMSVFGIPMSEILRLLNTAKNEKLVDVLRNDVSSDNLVLPGTESGLPFIFSVLADMVEYSKNNPVGLVLNEFLQKSGYLNYLLENDRIEELHNISEFAKQVTKYEKSSDDKSVLDFATYIDLLDEANVAMPADIADSRDSVQILTAHASKGLEFENVFIVTAVKHRFPSINRHDTFEIPLELTEEVYPDGDYHLQEERRLFYVSMTRAKSRLFITYSDKYDGNKSWKVSPFVEEIADSSFVKTIEHEETADAIEKLRELRSPTKELFDLPKFDKKRLSYSQIDTFQNCPLKYNFRYLMKVPVPPSHAGNFGTSVHGTLNDFYIALKRGDTVSFELMKELYEKNWIPYGYESKAHENARKKYGLEILQRFFDDNKDPWIIPAFLERPFSVRIGEYSISGRIDRIDRLEDGAYEVIDYKTGKFKKENMDKNLQLSIYALACKTVFKIPVSKLTLYYLESGEKVSTARNDEQINDLCENIAEIVKEMRESDFAPNPNFLCQYCDYRLICPAN